VDDHGGCRGLIREVLEGCTSINDVGVPTFVECASGEAALASLATTTPDLVTMDLRLGGMDGIECLRRMRLRVPEAVIVVVTCAKSPELARRSLLEGADSILCKDDLSTLPQLIAGYWSTGTCG